MIRNGSLPFIICFRMTVTTEFVSLKMTSTTTTFNEIQTHFDNNEVVHENVELVERTSCTHDVRLYRFKLPNEEHVSGIMPGKHIRIAGQINGKKLARKYSPVSEADLKGYFEVVFKVYPINEQDPSLGSFSRYLDSVPVGAKLPMSGPFGKIAYQGNGSVLWNDGNIKHYSIIVMIAGGTGITPMIQLIRSIMRETHCSTKIFLLYTNKTDKDVIFRDELERYARTHPEKFHMMLTLTRTDKIDGWSHTYGRINIDMARKLLAVLAESSANETDTHHSSTLVLICGRNDMNQTAKKICQELGYNEIHVY
ncbi:oxidoreductase FAD-binding domain-containing protein [Ditylenchus destructor]|uniref:NADH-cytochrome b5 reductase n=1 Tax=Ditylenchus destructor TaxID=166010 RepID=A0AAD4N6X0_9BILA|nr:oxidoreductase FAD-binding domain-containing protein [Ditylenchus destructor]